MLKPQIPSVTFQNKTIHPYLSLLIVFTSIFIIYAIPKIIGRPAGPDAITLWNSFKIADYCEIMSPNLLSKPTYSCTAYVLRSIGITLENAWLFGDIVNLAVTFLPLLLFRKLPLSLLLICLAWAACRSFFLENLTKEILVSFVVITTILFSYFGNPRIGWLASALIYAYSIRPYWIISLAIWFMLDRIKKNLSITKLYLITIPIYLLIAGFSTFVLGKSILLVRLDTNENRVLGEEGMRTLIQSWFPSENILIQSFDIFITYIRINFPIEAFLLSPGPYQLIIAIITPITIYMALKVAFYKGPAKNTLKINAASSLALAPIAFLITQSIFEPDYGSFTRHFSMLTPIIITAIALHQRAALRDDR